MAVGWWGALAEHLFKFSGGPAYALGVPAAAALGTTFGAGAALGTVRFINGVAAPNSVSSYLTIGGTLGALSEKTVTYFYDGYFPITIEP